MPELPEVETVMRHMKSVLQGTEFRSIDAFWKNSFFVASHEGQRDRISMQKRVSVANHLLSHHVVERVARRGKWIVISFSKIPAQLGIHLRMTGRIRFSHRAPALGPYDRVLISWSPRLWLIFQDMRKFGKVILAPSGKGPWESLGIEPFDPTFETTFPALLRAHRGNIKSLLLNQRIVAGIGNIYADETLFRAKIHPTRKANLLTRREQAALTAAIPLILTHALRSGGTTIRDYRNAREQAGAYQTYLQVYDRAGQPCYRCSTPIRRILISQRGTHFCPSCQR